MKKLLILLSSILILISVSCSSEEDEIVGDTSSSNIWSGPIVQFSKEDGVDFTHTQSGKPIYNTLPFQVTKIAT